MYGSGTGVTMGARPPSRVFLISCLTGVILALLAAKCGGQDPPGDLFLNDPANLTGNVSRACISRSSNQPCPDPMLHFYLYAGPDAVAEEINVTDPEWFLNSTYDSNLPTVVLVHGYRGGDSLGPMVILKNEYLRLGEHNLIMMDWGAYTRPPCYLQAIGSMRSSAKCLAQLLYAMEESGLDAENVSCVGHSLGAHLCGQVSNYRAMQKIIGLDPARPIFDISSDQDRLDRKDAKIVQVIHSNAGFYGMHNRVGTADFCINKGQQPFCTRTRNRELCSHVHALCFMAESLDPERARMATPCSPSCPLPNRNNTINGEPTFLGHFMNDSAAGMYCVDSETPPFCLTMENGTYGDIRCCPVYHRRKSIELLTLKFDDMPEDLYATDDL